MSIVTVQLPIARLRGLTGDLRAFCPNCDRKIAHVEGDRVVMEAGGMRLTCSAVGDPVMTCFKCGQASVLRLV